MLVARAVPPARLPRVREEYHRAHHPVRESVGIAVGVVGLGAQHPVGTRRVADERDGAVVAAKRCAGQAKSSGGVAECFADRLAPGLGVTAMVYLVEDDQGLALLGSHPVQRRVGGDLGVGDQDAVVVGRGLGIGVGESRVEREPVVPGGLRPLHLQMLGGHYHGDLLDAAMAEQFGRHPQRERRLARSRRGHGQKIARLGCKVFHQCPALPTAQRQAGVAARLHRHRFPPEPASLGSRDTADAAHRPTASVKCSMPRLFVYGQRSDERAASFTLGDGGSTTGSMVVTGSAPLREARDHH